MTGGTAAAISIRQATGADLPAVAEILNREISASAFLYMDAPVSLDERRGWLDGHIAASLPVLVAADPHAPSSILGWGSISPYRSSSGYRFTGEVSVYVAPTVQRRGVGRRILERLVSEARVRELHCLVASIDSDNAPSLGLFARHGFVEAARLPEVGRKFDAWRTQLLFLLKL